MTTILGELFKEGKSLLKEARSQIFGRPKKEKTNKYSNVHLHYHFYREKKRPR